MQDISLKHIIREIWAIDLLTHGDSAVANSEAFNIPLSRVGPCSKISWLQYGADFRHAVAVPDLAEAVADFASTRLASHRIVFVSESIGCTIG